MLTLLLVFPGVFFSEMRNKLIWETIEEQEVRYLLSLAKFKQSIKKHPCAKTRAYTMVYKFYIDQHVKNRSHEKN